MRNVLRSLFSGARPDTQGDRLDSLMAADNPPAALEPLLRALAADPRPEELGGLQESLAHYRDAFPMSAPTVRKTWRTAMLSPQFGIKLGAAVAGLTLALGGTAFAAYTGSLPSGAQNVAHMVIGAPAAPATGLPTHRPTSTGTRSESAVSATPVGPDASGPAAFGLCTAWTQHQSNGASTNGSADDSVAFKNLAAAAGGAGKVAAYCATILRPSGTSSHPTGRPTSVPSASHPMGRPTSLPMPTR